MWFDHQHPRKAGLLVYPELPQNFTPSGSAIRINRPIRFALVLAGLTGGWFAAGLSGDHRDPPAAPQAPAPPTRAAATRPASRPAATGVIRGKVLFRGTPPERKPLPGMNGNPQCAALHKDPPLDETVIVGGGGALRNVVVHLKQAPAAVSAGKAADQPPVVVDQVGCMYVPHVVAVRVGQKVLFDNKDPFLHHVHALPAEAEQRPAISHPNRDAGPVEYFRVRASETFKVKCDVHPWMGMWVAAFDHPFFAVTGDDGAFEISGLPPGEYTVVAWQERYKERELAVTVPAGQSGTGGTAEVDFTYEPVK